MSIFPSFNKKNIRLKNNSFNNFLNQIKHNQACDQSIISYIKFINKFIQKFNESEFNEYEI